MNRRMARAAPSSCSSHMNFDRSLCLCYRHIGDIGKRFVEQVGGFVNVGFCHGEWWHNTQGAGAEGIHQESTLQRLLHDGGSESTLHVDGLHQADAARGVDEVVFLAERLEFGAAIFANGGGVLDQVFIEDSFDGGDT